MAIRAGVDKWLFFTTVSLIVVGLAMVFSASAVIAQENHHFFFTMAGKQVGWAVLGLAVMLLLSFIDYNLYKSPIFVYSALAITIFLLAVALVMPAMKNTHRWIRIGSSSPLNPRRSPSPSWFSFSPGSSPRAWTKCTTAGMLDHLLRGGGECH